MDKKKVETSEKSTSEISTMPETKQSTTSVSQEKQFSEMELYLKDLEKEAIGIYVEELGSHQHFGVNEDRLFYGASIAKLPVIFYTQEQLKKGAVTLETEYPYSDEVNEIPGGMIKGGTGTMQHVDLWNATFSLETLLEWTICHSDNLASNMLSYYVAGQNGSDFLNTIAPFYPSKEETFSKNMTAETAGKLMMAIYQNQIGRDYFLETDWQKEKIGCLDKPVYHKIGTNENFNHDVGIVMGEKPYALSILSDGFSNKEIEEVVKEIDKRMNER